MELVEAWRLLRVRDSKPCTLFHGFHGSRTLPLDELLLAERKRVWNPGKKGKSPGFMSGWHVLLSESECREYMKRFKNIDDLVVCRVVCSGIHQKPRSKVSLARVMMIVSEDWEEALCRTG